MPEVTYTTTLHLPVSTIWEFVQDMNNWAPMLTGYISHEIKSDTHSVWTLKGDVGILARTVELDVHITEWVDEERVRFTLKGLNEMVEGGGCFLMGPVTSGDEPAAAADPPRPSLWQRMIGWVMRALYRRMHGTVERTAPASVPGREASRLSFTLEMNAGGPTAPLVNAMLEPAMAPAAEDLAQKIAAHLEATP